MAHVGGVENRALDLISMAVSSLPRTHGGGSSQGIFQRDSSFFREQVRMSLCHVAAYDMSKGVRVDSSPKFP